MQGVVVETTWMLGIIAFMVVLGVVVGIGVWRKRKRSEMER